MVILLIGGTQGMQKYIETKFYLIRIRGVPSYVGYTNRSLNRRFYEHLVDKGLSKDESFIELLETMKFEFSWDISVVIKNSGIVSNREKELIDYWGTSENQYQKGLRKGPVGGQTWSNVKSFVINNKDNPKYQRLSETEVIAYLEKRQEIRIKLSTFVNNNQDQRRDKLKVFVQHYDDQRKERLSTFVSQYKDPRKVKIGHFIGHYEDKRRAKLNIFIESYKDQRTTKLSTFMTQYKDVRYSKLSHFISHYDDGRRSKLSHFISHYEDPRKTKLTVFVNKTKYKEKEINHDE